MNHKVLGSVFVLAVSLGTIGVMGRPAPTTPSPTVTAMRSKPDLARPLASYRVNETPIEGGLEFRAANYLAQVSDKASTFGPIPIVGARLAKQPDFTVEFGSPRVDQGSQSLECQNGTFSRPAFGVGRVDRGAVIEEYVFENSRIEQFYRIPVAIGEGAFKLTIPVKCDLPGTVETHGPAEPGFQDIRFRNGGLAFCDMSGNTRMAYYSAVAIDAAGHQLALAPQHESGSIILEIPASYMATATYPVVIDPWLDFAGSGSGGGITNNSGTSINPALALSPGGLPFIAWSDNSGASDPNNFDIYVLWWNGFQFEPFANSNSLGGISNNTGKSVNPSIALDSAFSPTIAWEDDTSGAVSIYVKQWPDKLAAGAGGWIELDSSASGTGISSTLPPSQHPSVGILNGVIPGVITTNVTTGEITSTPTTFFPCPVVAFDCIQEAGSQVYVYAFYPGQPTHPPDPNLLGFPLGESVVPAGWYQLGLPNGIGVNSTSRAPFASASRTPPGSVAQYPSLVVDATNTVAVAWQDTRNGNYDIYCTRLTPNAAPTAFQIQSNATLDGFNSLPAANFTDITGGAFITPAIPGAGQVAATPTPSQYPSLSTDVSTGLNFTVAWQETEAAAPPNPGTSSQIYVARSTSLGGWTALAGSTSTGGISKTLAHASFPSCDVNGNYIGVAWADDSNSRSSIYARRFFLGAGGSNTWEQIGYQGSAFPVTNPGEFAPIGGISLSNSYSIEPKLKMDAFGSPTICWADGAGAQFDILVKTFSPNGPGIATGVGTPAVAFTTTLTQTETDPTVPGAVPVPVSGFSQGTSVFLSSRVFTETLSPAGSSLTLQIEVQPSTSPFTNSPNFQTLFVAPDNPTTTLANLAVLKFDGLPNFNYQWQARTVDQIGRSSPWIIAPNVGGVAFRINSAAPAGGGPGGNGPANTSPVVAGGTKSKGACGLLGLEALLVLGILRVARRKRST